MKLAILVVYLVSDENEKLLDIHLEQIDKYTNSPYKIYASVNLLSLKQRQNLRKHPKIKICDCPGYEGPMDRDRALYEHSYYLDHLVKCALEDDITHIVVLHPDSFPVKFKWESILMEYLSESSQLVTLQYSPTSCLFFKREFAQDYQPSFAPTIKTQQDKKFITYLKERNLILESGIGYKYTGYIEGFNWHKLKRTNKGNDHYHFGSIYGDLIFHLGAAEHKDRSFPEQKEFNLLYSFKNILVRLIPQIIKNRMRGYLLINPLSLRSISRQQSFEDIRNRLFTEHDNYIQFLRTGIREKL